MHVCRGLPLAPWGALLLLALPASAQAQTVNPDKLREAVCVPRPPFNFRADTNFNVNTADWLPSQEVALARVKADEANPESHLTLAHTCTAEQQELAAACCRRVLTLLELRVQQPNCSGWELAMYGGALRGLKRSQEALTYCQKAVAAAPNDYRVWREMAYCEHWQALLALGMDGTFSVNWKTAPEGWRVTYTEPPLGTRPEQAEAAARHNAAVEECLLMMRRLTPLTENNVHERMFLYMYFCTVGDLCDRVRGKPGPGRAAWGLTQAFYVEEFELLGQARGGDLSSFAMALQLQMVLSGPAPEAKDAPTAQQRKDRIVQLLQPVQALVEGKDRETAWTAAVMTGTFLAELAEDPRGELFYRKALQLAPEKSTAAENLARRLVKGGKSKEAVQLLEPHYRSGANLRCSLLLADALFEDHQFDRAEAVVRELTKHHEAEAGCQLALAAVCLRRAADPAQLRQAAEHLARAEKRLQSDSENVPAFEAGAGDPKAATLGVQFNRADPEYWWKQYQFLYAVYQGLTGKAREARLTLSTLALDDLVDPHVKLALKAFE
jgi:Flp pilus assembly protein TadD